jgi:hypothetical protein
MTDAERRDLLEALSIAVGSAIDDIAARLGVKRIKYENRKVEADVDLRARLIRQLEDNA